MHLIIEKKSSRRKVSSDEEDSEDDFVDSDSAESVLQGVMEDSEEEIISESDEASFLLFSFMANQSDNLKNY